MKLTSGTMLGRYRIEEALGEGQSGVVYRAFDTAIERIVAIKCFRVTTRDVGPSGTQVPKGVRFDEAKIIGQLNHPHITAVFDMGDAEGLHYIVMEHVQGETLKGKLARMRTDPASVPQVLSFIVMVARALHYVHQRGILHGDIKPGNLMVTPQGIPKIMDFGIARRSQANKPASWSLANESELMGTPSYLAPELIQWAEIDTRADVFSLGVVAYEWLAGRKPFQGENVDAILKALLHSRPPPLSEFGDFDAELSAAIDRSIARDPAQRFDSADAMADALEICQERWFKQTPKENQNDAVGSTEIFSLPKLKGRNLLFADFSETDLANVRQVSRQESYEAGDTILQEGTGGSTMYVVVKGRVSIRKTSGTKQIEVRRASRGECFGEMAVISQMPRSASVVALEPTEVVAISGAVLRSANQVLCAKLYRNIASLLADRMRERDEQMIASADGELEEKPTKRRFLFW